MFIPESRVCSWIKGALYKYLLCLKIDIACILGCLWCPYPKPLANGIQKTPQLTCTLFLFLFVAACGETIGGHHNWFGHQQPNEAVAHCRRPHRYCPPAGDSGRHFCHYHSRTKWLCKYRSLHKWCHQFLSLPLPMTSSNFKTNYLYLRRDSKVYSDRKKYNSKPGLTVSRYSTF